ncbi:MAG: UbiA prenyltransferase family protein [Nanoarchaeota archaeon]|nr:UbiA prenyltransferase family protein [Nanoarchaeota archaeon]
MKLFEIFRLTRPEQWYKNILIFVVPFFSRQIFSNIHGLFFGFILLCLVSSANYIINDILDREKDRLNPEKRNRPIASGKVSVTEGLILSALLLVSAFSLAFYISKPMFFVILVLFVNTQLYSFIFKRHIFMDVISVALNFSIRAMGGHAFVSARISNWVILCTFFLAILLATAKRYSEYLFVAGSRKGALKIYDRKTLDHLLSFSSVSFVLSVAIFPFFSEFSGRMLYLLPVLIFICFRYIFLVRTGSVIARKPQMIFKDHLLFLSALFYLGSSFIMIYLL